MRKFNLLSVLFVFAILILSSCQKEEMLTTVEPLSKEALTPVVAENMEVTYEYLRKHRAQNKANQTPASSKISSILRVPLQYSTIQAAVNAAMPGDRVQVLGGTYNELVACTTDDVSIFGFGQPEIIGGLILSGNNIFLRGFKVTANNPATQQQQPLLIYSSTNIKVTNNSFTGEGISQRGLWLTGSSNCFIFDNSWDNFTADAVASNNSHDNQIRANVVTNSGTGITIWNSYNERVANNTCNNLSIGIRITDFSHDNLLRGNEALNNSYCDIFGDTNTSNTTLINNTADCVNVP